MNESRWCEGCGDESSFDVGLEYLACRYCGHEIWHCDLIEVGSLVRYTDAFCRSISLHNPPRNGIVVATRGRVCDVWWCDQDPPESMAVLLSNLEVCPHDRELTDCTRATILAEFGDEK